MNRTTHNPTARHRSDHHGWPPRRTFAVALLAMAVLATMGIVGHRISERPAHAQASDRPGSADGSDAVQVANLIYAGTRSSVCFSEEFLSLVARDTTIHTARKFKPVKLADGELFDFPFAVMTGEGSFSLTESERDNLRRYLERGGFLLASAGCSSSQWDASFRREMELIFPDRALGHLSTGHDVFRTVYQIEQLQTKGADAALMGLHMDDKVVMIYSSDGLNDTTTMHGCCCCGGNEIVNAQQVNANILTYALLQ